MVEWQYKLDISIPFQKTMYGEIDIGELTKATIEEINIHLKAEITNNITGNFVSRRDMFNSRTVENTVGLIYHSQCWSLGLDYTQTDTDSRFLLKISLAGLGKW